MRTLPAAALLLSVAGAATPARADEGEPGARGFYLGGGGGVFLLEGTDEDGRGTGAFLGSGGHFRLGEEVLPGFTLGLELGGGGASRDAHEAGVGGFLLQATWRPPLGDERLLFLLGTGLGGGSLQSDEPDGFAGGTGGAVHQLGALWEIALSGGGEGGGWALVPGLRYSYFATAGGEEVRFHLFTLGVEATWYAGR